MAKVVYRGRVRVGATKAPSELEGKVLELFDRGVQKQLRTLSQKRVATVVRVGEKTVRGVPRKSGGRYAVEAPKRTAPGRRRDEARH